VLKTFPVLCVDLWAFSKLIYLSIRFNVNIKVNNPNVLLTDMLVRSQNNVYEWIDMFTCGLMFQPSLAILFKPFGFLALK
jgi:hypothetical protein